MIVAEWSISKRKDKSEESWVEKRADKMLMKLEIAEKNSENV